MDNLPTKTLHPLFPGAHRLIQGRPRTPVSGVRQDSRTIGPGELFVALPGFSVDGHDFIADAISNGAPAVVVQADRRDRWQPIVDAHPDVTFVEVEDTRAELPQLAAAFHDHPARRLQVVGVTGTDGKSTTSYLTHALLQASGLSVGLLNGVEFQIGGEWRRNETGETTPEADVIQERLAEMVARGDTHVVIEVSSHALALHRADAINAQVAVFTGLSDDHLDFHKTREQYLAAKLQLFRSLDHHAADPGGAVAGSAAAIVRAEDAYRDAIVGAHQQQTLIVSAEPQTEATVSVLAGAQDATWSDVRIVTPAGVVAARLPLPGDYNVGNAALAAGAAWAMGVRPVAMQRALRDLRPVPGRMEAIDQGQSFGVIVDAAATGPALDLALRTLKPHVSGRLLLVFGVAGERDPLRKSSMATAAAAHADFSVITNENPRSEDPIEMVDEIARHMQSAGSGAYAKRPDRREAIDEAVSMAQEGDLVLIAGKGAEPTMIYADRVEPWDDREVTRRALSAQE